MPSRRGAQPGVLRAMGLDRTPASISRSNESALCPLCRAALEFETDVNSQLIERCSAPTRMNCPNRRWRHPRPDPSILLPPDAPRAPRKKPGRKPSDVPSVETPES